MIARACEIPRDGFLQAYVSRGYTDCFEVMSPVVIDLEGFVEAFYSTWLFKCERLVLGVVLRRAVRQADVIALAKGAESFAAWSVEKRDPIQILLCDMAGHTRSYLAVSQKQGGVTRLVFGSAVVAPEGQPTGVGMRALMPLHRFYSKCLLRLAERKLRYS